MYDELYKVWKIELDSDELGQLPPDFFPRTAEYMQRLKEESRMLDKRTLKTNLLEREMHNARHMVQGVVQVRYRKVVAKLARGEESVNDFLSPEEKTIYSGVSHLAEAIESFAMELVRGQLPKLKHDTAHSRLILRFLKDVPAIIGADMKTYGPFKAEDVASLPVDNTKILIKRGLAEKAEIL